MLEKIIQTALLLVVLCTTATTYAQISQAPDGIQFQALATDANGRPAAGRVIYVKDAIVAKTATGTIVYSETFKVTASSAGIFTIVLGKGTYAGGVTSIANIDWANGPFFLNLKIAVEPTIPNASWNVNNEYVDLGTSQFWSVPYAMYAGNVKGADTKLNLADTAAMLKPYFTSVNLKANIESPTFTGTVSGITKAMVGLGNVDNTADINKPLSTAAQTALDLKANTTDVTSALALKANTADVTTSLASKVDKVTGKALSTNDYTTAEKTKLAAISGTNTGDQDLSALAVAADVNAALAVKANAADVNTALALKANMNDVNAALATKEDKSNKSLNVTTDAALDTKYPSVKAVKTYVDAQVSGATIADANATSKGKIQLAGDLAGTAAAPTVPGLALKENSANKSTNVSTDGASDSKYPSVKAVKSYVDAQLAAGVTSVTIADADANTKGKIQLTGDLGGTAASPTVPGLALKANATDVVLLTSVVNSNTASITANTSSITAETTRATAAELTLNTSIAANTASITANTSSITAETTRATAAELTLTTSVAANTSSITAETTRATAAELTLNTSIAANTSSITAETTRATAAELTLTTSVAANTASITANTSSITAETTRATAAESTLTTSVAANTASITATIAAIDLKAPIASPTFTGTLTAPIYATTPQLLTSGSTITWNPTQGLNASVTLDQNSTLSFSATPPSGSYGTLVVTQDGTGGRTITLPATANKVLGSTSTTSIALSTSAGAKDILNFYYDGTNCYWNIGQGYGTAATPASTNLASSVTGTLPVANGGTGANSLTGLVKGSGTSALIAAVAGTDYLAPNGSAANLTNFPTLNQNTTGNAATVTTNANLTGDVTSVGNTSTVVKINGTSLASLSTGILKNTTTTGVPTIAVAGTDYQAPISLTTTGTGAATLSGTTLNIPSVSSTVNSGSISGTIAVANGGTGATTLTGYVKGTGTTAMTASANIPVADVTGAAPLASPTFTGTVTTATINTGALSATSVNTPIYASTPQTLIDAATISWNPANGLNANVTLGGNRTLSFSTTPASGSYGTLVVTQDGTGGRTLTLPSGTHKVLGSATASISLSAAAGAKDILNFYYDGLTSTYYWNVGQGYGAASTFTANNIAGGAAGSIPYQTAAGATSLLAKGTDGQILTLASGIPSWAAAPATGVTSVGMSTPTGLSVSGSPITSSGTLALSMTTGYAIPTTASQTNWDAAYTNRITSASSPLSISSNALSLGTVPVSSGGTGATTLTGIIKGTGTSALTAAIAGTDYQAPLTLTTTGTGAATLSGTSLNVPIGVPYSGATGAVNLGAYDLTVNGVTVGRGNMKMTNNYAFGYAVLSANTTGNYNNAFGHQALTANTTGTENIAFGEYVLPKNIGGSQNTAVGSNALKENTEGNGNTGYGRQALATNTTGSYNTAIGYQANVATNNLTNATAIGNGASVSTSNTIQLGNTDVTNVKTSGTITAGDITYPKTHGSANQVLTTSGSGTLTWATPSTTATAYSGTLPIANGGTNSTATPTNGGVGYGTGSAHAYTSAGTSGQVLTSAGAGAPTWSTLAAVRMNSDEFTATAAQTVFTFTTGSSTTGSIQTPLSKPFMYINGIRIKNAAFTWTSGTTTVTYVPANNNSYTLVAGDRITFDYAY